MRVWILGLAGIVAAASIQAPAEARAPVEARDRVPAVVARVLPAVVGITTRSIEQDQFNRPSVTRGLGSGFIVDARGHVLTNHHVVAGATEIKVTLSDGRRLRAALVGADAFTDLAVLRIEGARLPALPLGDSTRLRIGEPVIAVGNPLWIEGGPTVTVGVVSGLGRSMEQDGLPVLHGLLQTDAAINPGNSGGPLLDLDGRVVGINTAVIASAHGIGFAIPASHARPVLRALLAGERIVRSSIRVHAVSLTPQVAWVNDLPVERGALVLRVDETGPAAVAGISPGDVITAVAGTPVRDLHDFHERLWQYRPGSRVTLALWRAGQTLTVQAALAEEP